MIDVNIISLLGSEIALSLYPQLIKLVPTTLESQIAIRFIIYTISAIIGLFITSSKQVNESIVSVKKENSIFMYIVMGIVNIFHVASSYYSFKILPSGISYTLFYTYPIFNILGQTIFNNEKIKTINYIYIIISIIGVYLIYSNKSGSTISGSTISGSTISENNTLSENANSNIEFYNNIKTKKETETNIETDPNTKSVYNLGMFAGILSAFTESLIYYMVKTDLSSISPYIQILKIYLLGFIFSIGYLVKQYIDNKLTTLDWHYWITLILFNTIVGFLGYVLRFFTIPRLSTLLFNGLIFIGVIFAYIWGYLLSNETVKVENLLGTLLILVSIFMISNSK